MKYILLVLFGIVKINNLPAQKIDYYQYTISDFRTSSVFNDTVSIENPDSSRLNAILFYITNEIRAKSGKSQIKHNALLIKSSSIHSTAMVEYNFFDHYNSKNKKWKDPNARAKFVGVSNPYIAENIAEGFVLNYKANTPLILGANGVFLTYPDSIQLIPYTYLQLGESILESWMNSPPHKENILNENVCELGCGTTFYKMKKFYNMPSVMATQNFQLFEFVIPAVQP